VSDSPNQAAYYHILGPNLGAASMTRLLAGTEEINIFVFILCERSLDLPVRLNDVAV
jgi:hypothetical protein